MCLILEEVAKEVGVESITSGALALYEGRAWGVLSWRVG